MNKVLQSRPFASTAEIYCNLKQPWLSSTTSNACLPYLILTPPCHEIGLLFCCVLLITIRSKTYMLGLIGLLLKLQGLHMHTSLLQDRQTGETINTSAPIWIFTYMFFSA